MTRLRRRAAFALALLLIAGNAGAGEIRPFDADSPAQIAGARAGRPFVLALWSLTCPHCQEELAVLGELHRNEAGFDLVLVSTDTPDDRDAVAQALERYGLGNAEAWVFADSFSERLRYALDRHWSGELPRSYLHGADGSVQAVSGRLGRARLEQWLAQQRNRAAAAQR